MTLPPLVHKESFFLQEYDRDDKNRDLILKCGNCPGNSRKRVSEYPQNENRSLIFPDRFLIAIVITIAVSKSRSAYEMRFF